MISKKDHPLYRCQIIDVYNFRSKFKVLQEFDIYL